jgi:hypothetical protein
MGQPGLGRTSSFANCSSIFAFSLSKSILLAVGMDPLAVPTWRNERIRWAGRGGVEEEEVGGEGAAVVRVEVRVGSGSRPARIARLPQGSTRRTLSSGSSVPVGAPRAAALGGAVMGKGPQHSGWVL